MVDLIIFLSVAFLCLFLGFVLGEKGKNSYGEKIAVEEVSEKEEELPFMKLRNGFGVTRDKDPTFAEQWVNIMNYSGESQTEESYEENERDYPEGYLE